MRIFLTYLLCSLGLLVAAPQQGDTILGKCVSVSDGDTISIYSGNSIYKVRLSGIDAPEAGQEFSSKAKSALTTKVKGKQLTIEVAGYDDYRRLLGKVMLDGESIEFWLVRNGWAWQFTKYDQSEELKLAQQLARKDGKGLWAGEAAGLKAIPPWEYRERQRTLIRIQQERDRGAVGATNPNQSATGEFWLNTGSYKRHNRGCRYYRNTNRGRPCGPDEGSACGICGG